MLRVAICDNDANSRSEILHCLNEHAPLLRKNYSKYELLQFSECKQLLNEFGETNHPDFVFITMSPEKSFDGIAISRQIRKFNQKTPLIIIGESPSYLPLGYEVNAFRYLLRPLDSKIFLICLKDILKYLSEQDEVVVFMYNREKVAVHYSDIIAAERIGRNLEIRLKNKTSTYKTNLTIEDFTSQLPQSKFLRTDRGVIINLNHVNRIEGRNLFLLDGTKFIISRERQKECFTNFCDYAK